MSFHDTQGDRRKTLYFGRMPEAGTETLKAEIEREVARIRELAESRLPILAVADAGTVDCWHACQHLNVARGRGSSVPIVLQFRSIGHVKSRFRVPQKSGLFDRRWSDLMAARDAANENHPRRIARSPSLRDRLRIET